MENFNDFLASYWQKTEADILPLHNLVEQYFKMMPHTKNKADLLTIRWDATKHSIVKELLRQKRLCKMLNYLGPFNEPLYTDEINNNAHIYLHWSELYVRL